jgi:hypothetical protein
MSSHHSFYQITAGTSPGYAQKVCSEITPNTAWSHGYDVISRRAVDDSTVAYVIKASSEESAIAAFEHLAKANRLSVAVGFCQVVPEMTLEARRQALKKAQKKVDALKADIEHLEAMITPA